MAEEPRIQTGIEMPNTEKTEPKAEMPDAAKANPGTEMQAQFDALSEKRVSLQRELQETQKELTKERDKLLRQKRGEIADAYDGQLKSIDGEIRNINDKRQKARSQGVKARIGERTASLHEENKDLLQKFRNVFKDRHAPLIARTGFFYALTMPRGMREIGAAVVSFLVIFGLLPVAVHALIPNSAPWHWAVIYFAVIIIFGGIYVSLNNVKTKYLDAVREGRKLRDQMQSNRRQIRKISREIRRDRDDTLYDLGSFDDMLAQKSQERAEAEQKKGEALEQFDAVTRNVLSDEIAAKYEEHFNALNQSISELDIKIKELEEKIKNYGKTADDKGNL